MKQCPACQSVYDDETLSYCLKDGAVLNTTIDRNATLQIPTGRETNHPTVRFSEAETVRDHRLAPPPGKSRVPIYMGIALVLLLVGGVAIAGVMIAWRGLPGSALTNSGNTGGSRGGSNANAAGVKTRSEPKVLFSDDFSAAELNSDWQIISGEWKTEDGILSGASNKTTADDTPVWAAMTLNRELPANFTITYRTKIVEGEMSELMLHVSNGRYVRAYLYTIDQAAVLGDGTFLRENKPGENGVDENLANIGGGPSVAQNAFPLLADTWYNVKVTVKDRLYSISIGGQTVVKYEDVDDKLNKDGTIGLISNGNIKFDDLKIVTAED